ncbi:MAG: xanthine dehydrogenase family protein subunit M [Rhodospirillaceae bacterium]|jgi:aerobic carbon-monoxide dehydrogenase medium subunit|nr:xanthine dehydrogenase family protein subunit M [Rhodospirillaceae bacterium]MBT5459456.1 xanthine dehydrogenase family protein subunit M [Rhodospirillaceae bacterium]
MKPPPFSYHDPQSVDDAVALLSQHENAKVLAGGQSLMPMLNMRYVLPDHVIDLNKIQGLSYIREDGDALEIGAMTRQRDLEYSDAVERLCPVMHEAIQQIGHRQTRNRGTIGGSLSHLDPAAELPAICAATDAVITVQGPNGRREIPFAEFPAGYMTPSIEMDEMVIGIRIPGWPAGHGYGFVEFARRHGDFAVASSAALLEVGSDGKITRASVTIGGVGAAPVRMTAIEEALIGEGGSEDRFRDLCEACREIDAMGDVYASTEYRQHLATVMSRRALVKAYGRATGSA